MERTTDFGGGDTKKPPARTPRDDRIRLAKRP